MTAISRVGRAYQEAADRLSQAQEKLALSQALGTSCRFCAPSADRQDYCADLERQAFELFELSSELYKKADKLARETSHE